MIEPEPLAYICGSTGLGGEERTIEVNGQHLFPIGEGIFLQLVHDLDAGVGDEDINTTPGGDNSGNASIDLIFAGHIHRHGHGGAGRLVINQFGGCIGSIEIEIGNDDFGTFGRIAFGNGLADAAKQSRSRCKSCLSESWVCPYLGQDNRERLRQAQA